MCQTKEFNSGRNGGEKCITMILGIEIQNGFIFSFLNSNYGGKERKDCYTTRETSGFSQLPLSLHLPTAATAHSQMHEKVYSTYSSLHYLCKLAE